MHENINVFSDELWPKMSASIINIAVNAVCKKKDRCNIVLTGGRGAELIYDAWQEILLTKSSLSFYFGDERCVSPEDSDSNYGMVMRTLFKKGIPYQYLIYRIIGETINYNSEAERYDSILPSEIDILILSMGEDTHIASLFPDDSASHKSNKRVAIVNGPKPPNPRISITPKLIVQAKQIFCLVSGSSKSDALFKVFQDTGDPLSFPAKLVQNGHWLVDRSAVKMIEIS